MIEIQILGPVTIVHKGQRVEVRSCQVRTILALLALSWPTPLRFEYLMDELWADRTLGNVRNALYASILRLRRSLERMTGHPGDQLVRTVGGGYLLDVHHDTVDANRFLDLVERGGRHVDREPKVAIELLERALELWRGPALADVSDVFRCRIEVARLEDRRLCAREDLITARLASGESRAVLAELSQLTTEYPERERFSEQLMLALYRNGRQTEALGVFHHARRRLAEEHGLEPGRALRQLHQAILVHDEILG